MTKRPTRAERSAYNRQAWADLNRLRVLEFEQRPPLRAEDLPPKTWPNFNLWPAQPVEDEHEAEGPVETEAAEEKKPPGR